MDKYIATRPVRFDRNYVEGEEIPSNVIDPRMIKRLTEAKRIIVIKMPDNDSGEPTNPEQATGTTPDAAQRAPSGTQGGEGQQGNPATPEATEQGAQGDAQGEPTNPEQATGTTPDAERGDNVGDAEPAPAGAVEFICDICGKKCGTKSALTAHRKTHD